MRNAVLLLFSLALPAAAQDPASAPLMTPALAQCAAQAYDDYSSALRNWHMRNARLVIERRSDFTEIAQLVGRTEAHRAGRDNYRVKYLAINAPYRLHVNVGLPGLGEITWSAEDEARLRIAEPEYPRVSGQVSLGDQQRPRNARNAAFEKFLELDWLASPEYLATVRALGEQISAAEQKLGACIPNLQLRAGDRGGKRAVSKIE